MTVDVAATTIVDAEVDGRIVDVRLASGRVDAVGIDLPRVGTRVVHARGGAMLPGLHDHHLHLLALAASRRSVDVTAAPDASAFDAALVAAHRERSEARWLRVVGYDEGHGPLDARRLDSLAPGRPVRVQHRTGAAWMLSTPARIRAVGAPDEGWWHRPDESARRAWSDDEPPNLAATSRDLATFGVTGVTDATPFERPDGFEALAAARSAGELTQRVMVMGGPSLTKTEPPAGLESGPVKVIVGDHSLADPDALAATFATAHRAGRPVAVHCVTRVALVVALAAWESAGAIDGDRIEHGSVIPVELVPRIAARGLVVVTQPGFVRARGDMYARQVDADDVPHLYRCGSLLEGGIGVGLSTDAPYGPADPWVAIAAASDRRTASGAVLGADEAIAVQRALDGFLSRPEAPAGAPRRVEPGAPADLCLFDVPLSVALDDPSSRHVAATWIAGRVVHGDP